MIVHIPLNQITPGDNDRTVFTNLEGLAEDIRQVGKLAQPITVFTIGQDRYEIIAGERRWRAFQILHRSFAPQWSTIPCIVDDSLSEEQRSLIMLSENLQRQDLDPIDEATSFIKRINRFGWTNAELAVKIGKTEHYVGGRIALLQLVPEFKDMVRKRQFPLAHARLLTQLNADNQRRLLGKLVDSKGRTLTFDQFSVLVAEIQEKQDQLSMWDKKQVPESFWNVSPPKAKMRNRTFKNTVYGVQLSLTITYAEGSKPKMPSDTVWQLLYSELFGI